MTFLIAAADTFRAAAVEHLGDAQVAYHEAPVAQQKNVLRFDVAV